MWFDGFVSSVAQEHRGTLLVGLLCEDLKGDRTRGTRGVNLLHISRAGETAIFLAQHHVAHALRVEDLGFDNGLEFLANDGTDGFARFALGDGGGVFSARRTAGIGSSAAVRTLRLFQDSKSLPKSGDLRVRAPEAERLEQRDHDDQHGDTPDNVGDEWWGAGANLPMRYTQSAARMTTSRTSTKKSMIPMWTTLLLSRVGREARGRLNREYLCHRAGCSCPA